MKLIKLSNSDKDCWVDNEDYDLVESYGKWYLSDTGYAVRRYKNSTLRMHRLIAKTPKGLQTDHRNNNRLDNRRCNLRNVSQAENNQNGSGRTHTKHKGLPKGITWDYSRNKYVATYTKRARFEKLENAIKFTKGI